MGRRATVAMARPREQFLTVPEVMARTGYGRHKVYDLIRSGELPSVKDGKYRRVRESTLNTYMEQREGVA